MYNANIPPKSELPSTSKLIKSTILAAIVATVLLVTVVMPAEYGLDPTGIGKITGLKRMGEIKMSLAQEEASERNASKQTTELTSEPAKQVVEVTKKPAITVTNEANQNHQMTVTLKPNEGAEIKVSMKKGKTVKYSWKTDGGRANYDAHADSKELKIDYHNYSKGSEQSKEGEIVAAFDGNHGWFWRNRTPDTLTVTLQTIGEYTDIKRIK
ncbi:MAG: transmembrane anchor protein [Blastocatellia bacterium]